MLYNMILKKSLKRIYSNFTAKMNKTQLKQHYIDEKFI
jgi:hypothetical protein